MDNDKFDRWAEERRQRRAERESRRHGRRERDDGAGSQRGRGVRKERVLHTRISDHLDESLRSAADEMRVPVSNLVRNVLEDVFTVVETVTENVDQLVSDIVDEAGHIRGRMHRRRGHQRRGRRSARVRDVDPEDDRARQAAEREVEELLDEDRKDRPAFEHVVDWQSAVLNGTQRCADCGRDMARGDRAYLGQPATPEQTLFLCTECLDARS